MIRHYNIVEKVDILDNATNQAGAITVAPSGLTEFTTMSTFWEQYKVLKLECRFMWDRVGSTMQSTDAGNAYEAGASHPFYIWRDLNDYTPIANAAVALQHDPLIGQAFAGSQPTMSCVPRAITIVGAATATSDNSPRWLDTQTAGAAVHTGIKWMMAKDAVTAGDGTHHIGHMFIYSRVTIAFRGAKHTTG